MKKIRKILTTVSLVALIAVFAMLIGAIFGLKIFEGVLLKILLSMAIITFSSALSLSALGFINNKKVLSLICIICLGVLALLGLAITWFGIAFSSWFVRITLIFGILTIFFNIIASQYIKLGKKYKVLQVVTYIFVAVLDILLTLIICGVNIFEPTLMPEIFAVICVVVVALLSVLSILARKSKNFETNNFETEYVKITKKEYQLLLEKIDTLEKENKELKSKKQI